MTDQRSSRPARRKPDLLNEVLEHRLLLYGFAAGAAIAAVPQANAKVRYTVSDAVVRCCTTFSIDLDHDGVADFILENRLGTFVTTPTSHTFTYGAIWMRGPKPANVVGIRGGYGDAAPLSQGQKIGYGDSFKYEAFMSRTIAVSPFRNVKNRYLGVRFLINGEVHYGWIGFRRVYNSVATFGGWAYETQPDTPIRAGDTGTPGTESVDLTQPTSLGILANGQRTTQNWRARRTKP